MKFLRNPLLTLVFTAGGAADINDVASQLPAQFGLEQNYPNPLNTSTVIVYGLPHDLHVTVSVYNVLGQRVEILTDADLKGGYHSTVFEASSLASGLYFYRLQAGEYTKTAKMLLLK